MRLAVVSLLLLLLALPTRAQESNYAVHTWTTLDGLPQNTVRDQAKTPDGSIWLATLGGVVRFDGKRFEIFDVSNSPELQTSRVQEVEVDTNGRLFVVTQSGSVLVRFGPHWHTIKTPSVEGQYVQKVIAGSDGATYLVFSTSVMKVLPGEEVATELLSGAFRCAAKISGGRLLLGGGEGLFELTGTRLRQLSTEPCKSLATTKADEIFLSNAEGSFRFQAEGLERLSSVPKGATLLGVDNEQRPWFVAPEGTGPWIESSDTWQPERSLQGHAPDDALTFIHPTDGGLLWIGTLSNGLISLARSPVEGVDLIGSASRGAVSVASDASGQIFAIDERLWKVDGPKGHVVGTAGYSRIASSAFGPIWALTKEGLGRFQDGVMRDVLGAKLLPGPIGAMLEARDGSLLISTPVGLFRWNGEPGNPPIKLDTGDAQLAGFLSTLIEGRNGRLILAGKRGILTIEEGKTTTRLSGRELPLGLVRSIIETPAGDLLAGTYGGGICLIAGQEITLIDTSRGLFENVASGLQIDKRGRLLVLGNRTLSSYSLEAIQSLAANPAMHLRGRSFDTGPGIRLFEGNGVLQPRLATDANGRLLVPTIHGLVRFDPDAVPESVPPPITRVVFIGPKPANVQHATDGDATFKLSPQHREFRVRLSVASFSLPRQVHYRYRLVGQTSDWFETDESNVVAFTQLAPGDYTFEVQAAIADGLFGPINSGYHVSVPPLWFERAWVRPVAVLFVVLLVAALGILRLRSARLISARLESLVQERTLELVGENQERRRVEEDLRKAGEELEDKVTVRTSELAHALANLEWDMRRREKLEGRLRESEKLEAVGRLAGGLAHDFNNILTAVLGETDLAQADLETNINFTQLRENLRQHLGNVRDAGMRAARLTRQLLAYSRQQVMQPAVVDPLGTLHELQTMLRRLVPDDVAISVAPDSASAPVLIDPGQLEQVIVNLVVNAAEAMPQGGEIQLSSFVTGDSSSGGSTVIQVTDNGIGLAEEDRGRIFEPFFSTKGKARGLGLASVHGIVLQSGGSLDVVSEPGEGTTFRVSLPVTTELPAVETPSVPSLPAKGLRVLLVDDEEDVLRIAKQMLERSGHSVLEAGDPRAALDLARDHAEELDVLVTDVVMPHMNGKQLSDAVLELCPNIKVLFISGYSTEVLSDRDLLQRGANLLAKPFDTQALTARVGELA